MTPTMNEKPRTYEFRFATTYGANGIEFAIVTKTMIDLKHAWAMIATPDLKLDENKVNHVRIIRR